MVPNPAVFARALCAGAVIRMGSEVNSWHIFLLEGEYKDDSFLGPSPLQWVNVVSVALVNVVSVDVDVNVISVERRSTGWGRT